MLNPRLLKEWTIKHSHKNHIPSYLALPEKSNDFTSRLNRAVFQSIIFLWKKKQKSEIALSSSFTSACTCTQWGFVRMCCYFPSPLGLEIKHSSVPSLLNALRDYRRTLSNFHGDGVLTLIHLYFPLLDPSIRWWFGSQVKYCFSHYDTGRGKRRISEGWCLLHSRMEGADSSVQGFPVSCKQLTIKYFWR